MSVCKEAVVLLRMENRGETLKFGIKRVDKGQVSCQYKMQKFGFIKRVDKGWITTVKDLESWRFER